MLEKILKDRYTVFPSPTPQKDVIIVEGSEAVALGAMVAGCRFFLVIRITPATSIAKLYVFYDT